ncbi:LemA family protein [Patescibacteria group bacterium]|nr:LemA family protein [Patescibacteria group bacterium]MBU1703571.1 LemA family protein [Patescibacteria group bacterium]MBU1954078.1 LemA family protein [Patescibacteria group bacterium]
MNQVLIVVLSLLVLLLIGIVFLFFYMRGLRMEVQKTWLDLLERLNVRLDKIPNLIETLRRLSAGDEKFLQDMVNLRAQAWPLDQADKKRVYSELSLAAELGKCWELAGKVPGLKMDTNFLALRTEFGQIAREIDERTHKYNEKARHYNGAREFFLFKLFLLLLGFKRQPILEFE